MPRRCIHSIAATRSSSTERSMPLRAESAWRRNWITDTPGISCGYWKARNIPALARSSAGHAVTSSPSNVMEPADTTYSGEPISVEARVLLPEPLGPMMACTSPAPTARSTPLRIGSGVPPPGTASSVGAAHRPSTRNSSAMLRAYRWTGAGFSYARRGNAGRGSARTRTGRPGPASCGTTDGRRARGPSVADGHVAEVHLAAGEQVEALHLVAVGVDVEVVGQRDGEGVLDDLTLHRLQRGSPLVGVAGGLRRVAQLDVLVRRRVAGVQEALGRVLQVHGDLWIGATAELGDHRVAGVLGEHDVACRGGVDGLQRHR